MASSATLRGEALPLSCMVGAFAAGYTLYGLPRHWRFGSNAYDLGIFDQAVWHLSRFQPPASSITGHPNLFGDHFHPIIALWAPLYWIAPAPETLIVAQALLFAVSIVPVVLFGLSRLPRPAAYTLGAAYGLFWGLQRAMAFDVHEIAFAPLLIGGAILALDRRRTRLFWTCIVGLILTKEDLIPLVAGFAVLLWARRERRQAIAAMVLGAVAFATIVMVVIPSLHPSGVYAYQGAFARVLERPWLLPALMVLPAEKLRTIFLWFAPFLFVPLASPLAWLAVPLAASRLLSESPNHWGGAFHYSAPLAPILAMAAADGLARLAPRFAAFRPASPSGRIVLHVTIAMALASAVLPGRQPLWQVLTRTHYRGAAAHETGYDALALIPASASVVAQSAIVPHLSQRAQIFVLTENPPDADYVIVASPLSPWPLHTAEAVAQTVSARFADGYTVIFQRDGWTVLARRAPPTLAGHPRSAYEAATDLAPVAAPPVTRLVNWPALLPR